MIEHKVTMMLTSADLDEMAAKAREIEAAVVGTSTVIRDWDCGSNVTVHVVLDQERATKKGLMG